MYILTVYGVPTYRHDNTIIESVLNEKYTIKKLGV